MSNYINQINNLIKALRERERERESMPATAAKLHLPDSKLWANLVLVLCTPLHQPMHAQLGQDVTSKGFYLKKMWHRWDLDQ